MKVTIERIKTQEEEQVLILCHEITGEILEIEAFIKSREENLEAFEEGHSYLLPLSDICYVESVDNHVFAYFEDRVYELKLKLYEFEESHGKKQFFRCSKSVIINLMKIASLKPALNGRFAATLQNGEIVIISRKYVSQLKNRLKGGVTNES